MKTLYLVIAMFFVTTHSRGVFFVSAFGKKYDNDESPIPVGEGFQESPMNYMPDEMFQGDSLPPGVPADIVPEEDGKMPPGIAPESHHRWRKRRRCRDKKSYHFCHRVLRRGHCDKKRSGKKCRKTCGKCDDSRECKDKMYYCYESTYYCSYDSFAFDCPKSCNLCKPEPTIWPVTTTTPTTDCEDKRNHCELASIYTCAISWFATGCRRSCNLCTPETTTQPSSTTSTSKPECTDMRSNCDTATKFTCNIPWFSLGCKKTCGRCPPEKTTAEPTESPTTTVSSAKPSETPTTTLATTQPPTASPTTTLTSVGPSKTPTTTLATTSSLKTTEGTPHTPQPEITTSTTEKTVGNSTSAVTGTTTEESITSTSTPESPEMTSATSEATEPSPCVDQNEKNCHVWESLGLCYNPQFMEEMFEVCPRSCGICIPN